MKSVGKSIDLARHFMLCLAPLYVTPFLNLQVCKRVLLLHDHDLKVTGRVCIGNCMNVKICYSWCECSGRIQKREL